MTTCLFLRVRLKHFHPAEAWTLQDLCPYPQNHMTTLTKEEHSLTSNSRDFTELIDLAANCRRWVKCWLDCAFFERIAK